jgi:hypothetical protein
MLPAWFRKNTLLSHCHAEVTVPVVVTVGESWQVATPKHLLFLSI